MKTRKEKIDFLKGVMNGKRKVEELTGKIELPLFRNFHVKTLPDGSKEYKNEETGRIYNEIEYDKSRIKNGQPFYDLLIDENTKG